MLHHCAVPGCASNSRTVIDMSIQPTQIFAVWGEDQHTQGERKEAWIINNSCVKSVLHRGVLLRVGKKEET